MLNTQGLYWVQGREPRASELAFIRQRDAELRRSLIAAGLLVPAQSVAALDFLKG